MHLFTRLSRHAQLSQTEKFHGVLSGNLVEDRLADCLRIAPIKEKVYHGEGHLEVADVRTKEEAILELRNKLWSVFGIAGQRIPRIPVGQVTIKVGILAQEFWQYPLFLYRTTWTWAFELSSTGTKHGILRRCFQLSDFRPEHRTVPEDNEFRKPL